LREIRNARSAVRGGRRAPGCPPTPLSQRLCYSRAIGVLHRAPKPDRWGARERKEHTLNSRRLLVNIAAFVSLLTVTGAVAPSADAQGYEAAIEFNGPRLLCLNDPQGNTANGVQLNVWECNFTTRQLFAFVPSSNEPGDYLLKLAGDTSKCLADPWDSYEDGIKLEVYTCSDTRAFQWEWAQFFSTSEFVNPNGMVFGNKDGLRKNGNPVVMWERNWGPDQDWLVQLF